MNVFRVVFRVVGEKIDKAEECSQEEAMTAVAVVWNRLTILSLNMIRPHVMQTSSSGNLCPQNSQLELMFMNKVQKQTK